MAFEPREDLRRNRLDIMYRCGIIFITFVC